ncbi:hypothetical protein [Priestia aryabhattai]|uniref:hypothetical protein n=1 Tax=Priestia aryabhattai TaxID=412384 RepID=UPI0015F37852|nr:hypothetical protein [Priestia aryabhattai]
MNYFQTKEGKRRIKVLLRTKKKRIKKKIEKDLFGNLFDDYDVQTQNEGYR